MDISYAGGEAIGYHAILNRFKYGWVGGGGGSGKGGTVSIVKADDGQVIPIGPMILKSLDPIKPVSINDHAGIYLNS